MKTPMRALALVTTAFMALSGTSWAQAASDYRIVITNVNSSDFPRIELEFQVLTQNPAAPAWNPASGVNITEQVLGEAQAVDPATVSPIVACHTSDVVVGVAVDISGSVAGVRDEIVSGVETLFQTLRNDPNTSDRAGFYAFDSVYKFRYPPDPASPNEPPPDRPVSIFG